MPRRPSATARKTQYYQPPEPDPPPARRKSSRERNPKGSVLDAAQVVMLAMADEYRPIIDAIEKNRIAKGAVAAAMRALNRHGQSAEVEKLQKIAPMKIMRTYASIGVVMIRNVFIKDYGSGKTVNTISVSMRPYAEWLRDDVRVRITYKEDGLFIEPLQLIAARRAEQETSE